MVGRSFDPRAIAVGTLAQAPLFPFFRLVVGEVGVHVLVGPAVSGIVAGVLSRTYQDEFVDGALAALFGLLVSIYVDLLILAFLANASLRIAFYSTANLLGAVLTAGTPIALIAGAMFGSYAARFRRRRWGSPLKAEE